MKMKIKYKREREDNIKKNIISPSNPTKEG